MTRSEKWKHKRHKLKLEGLVIETTYLQNKSAELLKYADTFQKYVDKNDDWWKHYQLMEDFKPR